MGGYAMAYHCSELPFVFSNIHLQLQVVCAAFGTEKHSQSFTRSEYVSRTANIFLEDQRPKVCTEHNSKNSNSVHTNQRN